MKTRTILFSMSIVSIFILISVFFIITVQAEPSFSFYKNIQMLNAPSQFLVTFKAKVTDPERVQGLNIHFYNPEKQKGHTITLPGGDSFYHWNSEKKKFFFTYDEYNVENDVEDPMNFGIFSDSTLWERIFKEKNYKISKDYETGLWRVTIPAAAIKDALLEDQKKVMIVFNDLYESHECYQGLVENKKVTNVTSDTGLTGNLIVQIDPKSRLIRSIEIPDLESFEVQYSGTACNKPGEKVSGFYDIVSTESVKFVVNEVEEDKDARKGFHLLDKLMFMFGRIEI